ncbi:MAG: hypothetical protein EHM64_08960 [Ignavibacteriae bacterium]|nr:MAG: hypothetical protein EHM64_08960 [Ignavibacteriota bacterium]
MNRFLLAASFFCLCSPHLLAQNRPLSALVTGEYQERVLPSMNYDNSNMMESRKSVVLAVVASLILPGMGEWYAGSFESGKYNLMAEGGLWLTYSGFRLHADWLQEDARSFAKLHSGASFDNKDDQYSVNIGNFSTTDEYNQAKLRNRENDLVYTAGQYQWQWDTDINRNQFKELRVRSAEVKNNSKFIIAAVVVNHLFSAFSAGRRAAAYNKSLSLLGRLDIQTYTMNIGSRIDGVGVNFSTKF